MKAKANGLPPPPRDNLESDLLAHNIGAGGDNVRLFGQADEGGRLLQLQSGSRWSSRDPSPSRICENQPSVDGAEECDQAIEELFDEIFRQDSRARYAAWELFFDASTLPPVTKGSLSELDIGAIINNSKLRHDVNFDRELHFRPNLDGDRGMKKRRSQREYWDAVAIELQLVSYVLESNMESKPEIIKLCSSRLEQMFTHIKQILRKLVPDRDQSDVDDHLDISMLMQEIGRGVCDFVKIATWLAQLLKRHCAPMRDEMVDRMVAKIEVTDSQSIADGLCDLFGVLEAMKLDVANHQIRHLRALLIEDTINFEKKYHVSRIKKGRYRIREAKIWYKNVKNSDEFKRIPLTESWPNRDVEAFVTALLRLLMPTSTATVPDTFVHDLDRIRAIRWIFDDMIKENICCDILKDLLRVRHRSLPIDAKEQFRVRLHIIVNDGRTSTWHERDIACELVRHVLRATGSSSETDADLEDRAVEELRKQFHDRTRAEKHAKELEREIYPRIFRFVEDFLNSSPCDIFNALVAPPAPPTSSATPGSLVRATPRPVGDRSQDLVKRIAHVAVLHWRVWEELVYNNPKIEIVQRLPPPPPPAPVFSGCDSLRGMSRTLSPRVVLTSSSTHVGSDTDMEVETEKQGEEVSGIKKAPA